MLLDRSSLVAAYTTLRSSLVADPLLMAGPGPAALDGLLAVPGDTVARFWQALEGSTPLRYAGLRLLLHIVERTGADRRATLRCSEPLTCIPGDLVVDGDVIVDEGAALLVLGRLEIGGNLLADVWDYTSVAAREISMRSGISGGEVIGADGIRAADRLYLCNTDHGCVSSSVSARVLVDFERSSTWAHVSARHHVTAWDFEAAAVALGIPNHEGDLRTACRRALSA